MSDFFPLSGSSLRNWLRTDGQRIFTEFTTGREALDWFRDQGGRIGTQAFYDIRREVLGLTRYESQISRLSENSLVPASWHSIDHGLNLSSNFLYRVKVSGYDFETGEPKEIWVSVASNTQLTRGQIEGYASMMVVGEEEAYGIEAAEFDFEVPLARPDAFE